jgi:hypothetical protein
MVVIDEGEMWREGWYVIQAGCRRQGMMPTHTPKERDEITWKGCEQGLQAPST